VPCWDKECETLCRSFIRAPVGTDSDRAASSLLSQLRQKKQEWWVEAVNSIDFSHSSRKVWRTINKLTGKSGRSSCLCPTSANSITSQLMKNGAHRTGGRKPTRFVHKQLSDLWKIPTPKGHSSLSPNPLGRRGLLLPSDAWNQESLRDWIPSYQSLYSKPVRLSKLGFATSLLPACASTKFQTSGEKHY